MAYRNSQIDRQNFSWFASDRKVNSLVEIELDRGRIAQLGPLCAHFTYPVAAFCGERGAGGSALLAVAACAYHGRSCPPGRQKPYYTFGDFFTFSADDAHIKGCVLRYTLRLPLIDVVETRRREPCQRWNDYARRSERAVYYLDRDRVPGAEAVLAAVAAVGRGGMVCVEQLEWGLSVPQQKKLVTALKALCAKNHCQLLCTTRSPAILAALPPAARYRLVQQDGQTLLEHPVPPEAALPQHREKLPIYLQKEAGPWFWGLAPLALRQQLQPVYCHTAAELAQRLGEDDRAPLGACTARAEGRTAALLPVAARHKLLSLPPLLDAPSELLSRLCQLPSRSRLCDSWGCDDTDLQQLLSDAAATADPLGALAAALDEPREALQRQLAAAVRDTVHCRSFASRLEALFE
ncbi:Uncharacterised protein [Anaerotruncus sp. 2789STDY5834896]|uniref:Uncharacterized protein n=1 Tax=uncultured Anaerotruncus sp. TaxID=905011 RepID=A0A1C6J577_9FIRM|nr:Uncharacterised protein [uncultured Anaerotruncus sp.]